MRFPRLTRRLALRAAGLSLGGAFAAWLGYVVLGPNRHEVIPGRVYRCSQPGHDLLIRTVDRFGIRTVINLRGFSPEYDWYKSEARATADRNVNQEDVTFSANRLPPPAELRRLIDILDRTAYPILIHCKQGADRTGLVSAMTLLLFTDATPTRARQELWPIRGHFRFGRTAAMDDFFDRYETWLTGRNESHTRDRFREWATTYYSPGPDVADLKFLDPIPDVVPANKPIILQVRATNRSSEAWELKPGSTAGIHLGYSVWFPDEPVPRYAGKAGLFRRTVSPGESVDLDVVVPALKSPGTYLLKIEMFDYRGAGVDARAMAFVQFGAEPLLAGLRVK
ncbi:MAG TPA: tyrosine-protein phosphatase [Fimbriiglobus sp.]